MLKTIDLKTKGISAADKARLPIDNIYEFKN